MPNDFRASLSPILVVDDNPTDVFFLEYRLRAAGVTTPLLHAEDGIEAVERLERSFADNSGVTPWLMFVDLKMPRMDGFEVLRWLAERRLTDRVTVAVLSTSDEPRDLERAQQLGAHRYLVKYPQPAELAEVVTFARRRIAEQTLASAEAHPGDS